MFKTISNQDAETEAATHWIKPTGAWSHYSLAVIPKQALDTLPPYHNYGDSGLHFAPSLTNPTWRLSVPGVEDKCSFSTSFL